MLNGNSPKPFDSNIAEVFCKRIKQASEYVKILWNEQNEIERTLQIQEGNILMSADKSFDEAVIEVNQFINKMKAKFGGVKTVTTLKNQTVILQKIVFDNQEQYKCRFVDEDQLTEWFKTKLTSYFYIYPQVKGKHSSGKEVIIDFILYPNQHLVEDGFDASYFGVEVKFFNLNKNFRKKMSRGIAQAISYNDSQFILQNKNVELKYSLIFSNLSFMSERSKIKNSHDKQRYHEWQGMMRLANHLKVGNFELKGTKEEYQGWALKFGDASYFSCSKSKEEVFFYLSNSDLIETTRVGNF